MRPDELTAIEARANAATEGPWRPLTTGVSGGDHWYIIAIGTSIAYISAHDGGNEEQRQPDAEFIAHARDDIPALLADLRERDNTIARVRAVLDSREYANFIPRLRAALDPQETL